MEKMKMLAMAVITAVILIGAVACSEEPTDQRDEFKKRVLEMNQYANSLKDGEFASEGNASPYVHWEENSKYGRLFSFNGLGGQHVLTEISHMIEFAEYNPVVISFGTVHIYPRGAEGSGEGKYFSFEIPIKYK